MPVVSISTVVLSSIRTRAPMAVMISSAVVTSRISGIFSIMHLSSTSIVEKIMGSAAFFIPLTSIFPLRRLPPLMINRSMYQLPFQRVQKSEQNPYYYGKVQYYQGKSEVAFSLRAYADGEENTTATYH